MIEVCYNDSLHDTCQRFDPTNTTAEQLKLFAEEIEAYEHGMSQTTDQDLKQQYQQLIYKVNDDIETLGRIGKPAGWKSNR